MTYAEGKAKARDEAIEMKLSNGKTSFQKQTII